MCMPLQPKPENLRQCCKACLEDICSVCLLPKADEHDVHCQCEQEKRNLSDTAIMRSLIPLLETSRLNRIMKLCADFIPIPTDRLMSRPQLVLPDYNAATISLVRSGILAECAALWEKKIVVQHVSLFWRFI